MNWKQEVVESVWQHGRVMPEADPSVWRQDMCGAWIQRNEFARNDSEFGWKIENIKAGGTNTSEDLRPFHWRNHFEIANQRSHCQVRADRGDVPAGEYARPPHNRSV